MIWTVLPVSAVVPSLLLMWYFHSRDLYREPPRVLWTTFGLGVGTTLPVILVAMPLTLIIEPIQSPHLKGLAEAFVMAAIPEECFKFLVVRVYCARHKEFDEPMDGIVYGVAASLGFASLENILYVSQGGLGVALMRAVTAVPNHAFLGAIMGYYIGQARFHPESARRGNRLALLVPILLHGLYDYPLLATKSHISAGGAPSVDLLLLCTLVPGILIFEWIWATRLARRLRRQQEALGPTASATATPSRFGPTEMPAGPYSTPTRRRGPTRVVGWLMIIVGGLLAIAGGFIVLGFVISLASDANQRQLGVQIIGVLVAGVIPLAGGGLLFGFGLRLLNRP